MEISEAKMHELTPIISNIDLTHFGSEAFMTRSMLYIER